MSKQIKLAPCPFCEGPPCVSAHEIFSRREVFARHRRKEHEGYEAHVWCHECGARGPSQDDMSISIFEHLDLTVGQLLMRAARKWNDRHNKARACYDGGEDKGLNLYPRASE